jgi:hypothetical protein
MKKKRSKYYISETNTYKCECGKEFEKSQSINSHFSHCFIHRSILGKDNSEEYWNNRNHTDTGMNWNNLTEEEIIEAHKKSGKTLSKNIQEGKTKPGWLGKKHSEEDKAKMRQAAINYITSNYVSIDICNSCQDRNVKALEIKQIIENLLNDSKMLPQIKRIINLLICDFKATHRNEKIASINFLDYTITAKPNTKNKYLLEIKSTIVGWLEQYSEKYKVRSRRRPDRKLAFISGLFLLLDDWPVAGGGIERSSIPPPRAKHLRNQFRCHEPIITKSIPPVAGGGIERISIPRPFCLKNPN